MITKFTSHVILGAVLIPALSSLSYSQTVFTNPVGYNRITCLNNSDTVVGVPFRAQGSLTRVLAAAPTILTGGESATLSMTGIPTGLTSNYVMFTSGTRNGRWYNIASSTTSSVTINLNGDNLNGVVLGNSVVIAQYWTLDTLFPPAQATTAWTLVNSVQTPNGHAIVASANTTPFARKTSIVIPDSLGTTINRVGTNFYSTSTAWYRTGQATPVSGQILYPDTSFIIRHPSSVLFPTVYRAMGDVVMSSFSTPLATNNSGRRDSYVSIPRPVPTKLSELNLTSTGAFVSSADALPFSRKDELLLFSNDTQTINKNALPAYFHTPSGWRQSGVAGIQDDFLLPAGVGFIIRKSQIPGGITAFWSNQATY